MFIQQFNVKFLKNSKNIAKNQEVYFFEQLKREVDACEKIIKVQKENEEKLINSIKKLKKQNKDAENEKDLIIKLWKKVLWNLRRK